MNEKEGLIVMNLLIYMYYNSQSAAWNPADYGGIDTIEVARQTFWTPDIGKCNIAFDISKDKITR